MSRAEQKLGFEMEPLNGTYVPEQGLVHAFSRDRKLRRERVRKVPYWRLLIERALITDYSKPFGAFAKEVQLRRAYVFALQRGKLDKASAKKLRRRDRSGERNWESLVKPEPLKVLKVSFSGFPWESFKKGPLQLSDPAFLPFLDNGGAASLALAHGLSRIRKSDLKVIFPSSRVKVQNDWRGIPLPQFTMLEMHPETRIYTDSLRYAQLKGVFRGVFDAREAAGGMKNLPNLVPVPVVDVMRKSTGEVVMAITYTASNLAHEFDPVLSEGNLAKMRRSERIDKGIKPPSGTLKIRYQGMKVEKMEIADLAMLLLLSKP